jgi:ribonuclease P protein component
MKKSRGPLTVFSMPNLLPHYRLGLAVGRRCGGAVERNLLKRLIREAFRLGQHDLPLAGRVGYDFIVHPKAHKPLPLADYRRLLGELAEQLHAEWQRRDRRNAERAENAP